MEKARPHERVPARRSAVGTGMTQGRSVVRQFELYIREAAPDYFAKHRRLLVRGAIDPGFVSELQADAIVADPADGAFHGAVLAEVQCDRVPHLRGEAAADHRSAAGDVDQIDLVGTAVMVDADCFAEQPMPVVAATVRLARFLARHDDAVECVAFRALRHLRFQDRFFDGAFAAENLLPDVHSDTPLPGKPGLCPRRGYEMVHLAEVMPVKGMGRWEGPLHRRPERTMLPKI